MLRNTSMIICNSLLKHGYSNFSLTILEYCEPEKCLEREGYYLKLFKPEYNIAQDPTAPMSGRTHSDASKTIMSEAKKGENNPFFGKNHSDETRKKMSDAKIGLQAGENHPFFGKNHSDETKGKMSEVRKGRPRTEGSGRPSQKVEVFDLTTGIKTTYDSISDAAIALGV